MTKIRRILVLVSLLVLIGSLAWAHGDDSVTVLVGAGQDTTVVSAFLPEVIRVKVGTTVTWRIHGDEIHTVTFLEEHDHDGVHHLPPFVIPAPEGQQGMILNPMVAFPSRMPGDPVETIAGARFVNSGVMSHEPMGPDAPPNDTFSVTFTEPGTYQYHCILHPWMKGTVVVEPADADVPSHDEIDAAAEAQMTPLLNLVDVIREQAQHVRSEPGPDGTTIWYVEAGAVDFHSGDPRAAAFEFFPEHLTIEAGDTVIWMSPEFHTVTFTPVPPMPDEFTPVEQEQGPPLLVLNPEVFGPVKPAGTYDAAQYFNSGIIGTLSPAGHAWSMTFVDTGTYEYGCVLHDQMGMTGTITVVDRQ